MPTHVSAGGGPGGESLGQGESAYLRLCVRSGCVLPRAGCGGVSGSLPGARCPRPGRAVSAWGPGAETHPRVGMDLVGSSVFCRGSCSRSKLLIFVSAQGCRGSELVSVSQENLWAVTDRGCVLRAGAPATGSHEEAVAPKVGLSPPKPLNPEKQATWQRPQAAQPAGSAGSCPAPTPGPHHTPAGAGVLNRRQEAAS